ncbi:CopD family protein [Microbulbifer taiwanensis]|uniref:Copper resistance protein D n=1 Tax=Microbulbifer taiwanensis TaxID=986746 RepID=A0ABW1YHK2_9GAMM|nr:CopD family protein [Microbulbifer taiwanensis]
MTLEVLAALLKWLLYGGALASAGAVFARMALGVQAGEAGTAMCRIITAGAGLATAAAVGTTLVLLTRLGGIFESGALAAVWLGPAGLAAGLQLGGGLAMLLSSIFNGRFGWSLAGAVAMLASFGISGHAASLNVPSGLIVVFHAAAAAWWLGALFILRRACIALSNVELLCLVRRFSRLAEGIIGAMVAAGVLLILALVKLPLELTPYLVALSAKIALAGAVLALAVYNRLSLTPKLASSGHAAARRALGLTIGIEIAVIAAVLAATAILTSLTSPHQ